MTGRQTIGVLACCLLAIGPAGADGDRKEPAAADPAAIAGHFVDLLAAADFDGAVRMFDATMKGALPASKLREVWTTLNAQAGPYKERTGTRAATEQKYRVIYVACRFEKTVLEAKVVFDADTRIAGLFFLPPPASSSVAPLPDYARPASYAESEVRVGDDPWSLPGTIARPRGTAPVPGIVLVHGSGPLDRDETVGPNRPFRDLAVGLASRGIAVLRYDKRTLVHGARMKESGDRITLREEIVDDAVRAVRLLKAAPGVDGARVFVLGHSLGGVALPRIAAAEPGIAGFALLATPSRPLLDVWMEQVAYLFGLDGVITDEERAQLETMRAQAAQAAGPAPAAGVVEDLPLGIGRAWWDDVRSIDAGAAPSLLRGRVIVLQGGRDYQVTTADYDGWRRIFAGRPDATFRLYPALNHLFMSGAGPGGPSEYETAGHVAAAVVDDLAAWVKGAASASPA